MAFNPIKPFASYLRPHRKKVVLGLVMLFCVQAIQGSIPMLLKWAVDTAKAGLDAGSLFDSVAGTWTGSTQGDLALYAGIMVVLALVQWAMNFGMRWYITCVSRFVERDIRSAYVGHLVRLPFHFFRPNGLAI